MADLSYRITIKPKKGWATLNVRELWFYKELFYIFAWRDIKVRYKQTAIGILWALLQPFLSMVIFSIFFGGLAKIPSNGIPYPIFVFSGLLFWNYFSTSLSGSSNSLIMNEGMIKKIFFPRLLLPLSATITPIVDFGFALVVLVGLMIFYHFTPTVWGIILLPGLILLSFLSASGLGSFFAAINIRYRDVREALPFFVQTIFFVTPVIYPTTLVPVKFQWVLALNPMTGIIEAARAGIVGNKPINFHLLLVSTGVAVALFLFGVFYFKRTEKIFADIA
ncbi:MAG: ABC transporter permease [Candidatus Kerfeldbacteria bacterium]|nr:ABC transporter permease [Candidatus Kerfeldbacteria bacterium]